MAPSLQQKLFVEFVGTALLCFTVSCLPKVAEDISVVAGKSATIAVYWAGPALGAVLGAVLGTGLFKTAYKGESKKKSKRKTR